MASDLGWSLLDAVRKRQLREAILAAAPTPGPVHLDLVLVDSAPALASEGGQPLLFLPFSIFAQVIDEAVAVGLRAVSLCGAQALAHRDIARILDHLAEREVVIDSAAASGELLVPGVVRRLISYRVREVELWVDASSLLAFGPPAEAETEAARGGAGLALLAGERGSERLPSIAVRLALDWMSVWKLPDLYSTVRSAGADRLRLERRSEAETTGDPAHALLKERDWDAVRPLLAGLLERDQGAGLLEALFPWPSWQEGWTELSRSVGLSPHGVGAAGSRVAEEPEAQCFLGWCSAALSPRGELFPCRKLIRYDRGLLGTVLDRGLVAAWHGDGFQRLRQEMRDVLLTRGRILHRERRFRGLARRCLEPGRCGWKSRHFCHDVAFYRDLESTLEKARRRDVALRGSPPAMRRWLEVFAYRVYHGLRVRSHGVRQRLRRELRRLWSGRARSRGGLIHVGCGPRRLEGWVNVDLRDLSSVDLVADATKPLGFNEVKAVFGEHFLEHLDLEEALEFLVQVHRCMAADGCLRLSTPNVDWVWATHYQLRGEAEERRHAAVELNRAFYGWQHRFLWNRDLLQEALEACGFASLRWCRHGETSRAIFRGVERHPPEPDSGEMPHLLVVEATKGEAQPRRLEELRRWVKRELLGDAGGQAAAARDSRHWGQPGEEEGLSFKSRPGRPPAGRPPQPGS